MTNAQALVQYDEQEVKEQESKAKKALAIANKLEVTDDATEKKAVELMSNINKGLDDITARKEAITKPLNAALKSVRDLFRPIEADASEAVSIVKSKLRAYAIKREDDERKKREALAARVEKGTMKEETAMRKLDEMPEAPKAVQTRAGAVTYKDVKKVRIGNIDDLTDTQVIELRKGGYLTLNEVAIRKDALAGKTIPGAEVYTDKEIANTR